jgi:hypothetical protein
MEILRKLLPELERQETREGQRNHDSEAGSKVFSFILDQISWYAKKKVVLWGHFEPKHYSLVCLFHSL